MAERFQLRTTAVLCFLCVVALTAAFPMQVQAQAESESPDAVVSPGESIQNAINAAAPGDTIELEAGTYDQGIVIDKDITITASGDVTLDGDGLDTQDGIVVDAADVTIEGVEIARFSDNGIDVRGNVLAQRQIEILNVTTRLNGQSNIIVSDGAERDTVVLKNVVSQDSGDRGVEINAENVTVENAVVEGSEDSGLEISAGSDGTVTIENTVASNNGVNNFNNDGIRIRSGKDVTIEDTESTTTAGEGITIFETDAISGGRTVSMSNVTSAAHGRRNLFIGSTNDQDSVVLTDIVSQDSGETGIEINAENVTVENAVVEGSEDSGLEISAGSDGTVTIENTVASNNGVNNFNNDGIRIRSGKDVTIEDTESTSAGGEGITIFETGAIDARTVLMSNVTSAANGFGNLFIGSTNGQDSVVLTDIVSQDSAEGGIEINAENTTIKDAVVERSANSGLEISAGSGGTVTVEDAVVKESGDSGLEISAGSDGTVTIQNTVASNNGDSNINNDGIRIRSGENVTIEDTETTTTAGEGITIFETGAPDGRTITFTNLTSRANGVNGAFIGGTADEDATSVTNSEFAQNGDDGIEVQVESANITQTNITGNSLAGIRFSGAFTGGIVTQSSFLKNNAQAIINTEGGTTVDATNNWWGDPRGPATDDIIGEGNVDTTDPLQVPPESESEPEPTPDTVTVGGQTVPAEFTTETDSGDRTVTADNAVAAINTFIEGGASADIAVDVINAFIAS